MIKAQTPQNINNQVFFNCSTVSKILVTSKNIHPGITGMHKLLENEDFSDPM